MSQPPGPPPGPPPGYGPPGPPPASPGRTLPLVVGALLGGVDIVVTTLFGLGVGGSVGSFSLAFVGPVVGLAIPVVLLFNAATRWWGVGMLIGYFLTLIVLGGACAVILYSLSLMSGMPLRGDRIHRYVNAFCPHCHEERPDRPLAEVRRLSGWLVVRDDRVWLERGCPDHGLVTTLYDESPEILSYLEQWTAPTKAHTPDVAGNFKPVPSAYEDGLPEMQTQHTCILLEDITDHCNLRCPTCFAESSPALAAVAPLAARAGVGRHPAVPRERPPRRADALRRRADALPLARRAPRRGGGAAGGPDPGQHQRAADRPGRRAARRC